MARKAFRLVKQQKLILEYLLHHHCHMFSSHMPMVSDTCRCSHPRSKKKFSARLSRLPTIDSLVNQVGKSATINVVAALD
jgi:hypothetical protein